MQSAGLNKWHLSRGCYLRKIVGLMEKLQIEGFNNANLISWFKNPVITDLINLLMISDISQVALLDVTCSQPIGTTLLRASESYAKQQHDQNKKTEM